MEPASATFLAGSDAGCLPSLSEALTWEVLDLMRSPSVSRGPRLVRRLTGAARGSNMVQGVCE